MEVAALIIAIVSLILALVATGIGVWLQFRINQETTRQISGVQELVGELRGMTGRLVEAQERQFDKMLEAFVTRPGIVSEAAEKATESEVALQDLRNEVESITSRLGAEPSIAEMRAELEALAQRVDEAKQVAAAAARFASEASLSPARRTLARGQRLVRLLAAPIQVSVGGIVNASIFADFDTAIGAFEMAVLFDPAMLRARGCAGQEGVVCNPDAGPGEVLFAGASVAGMKTEFALGTVEFEALKPGDARLRLRVGTLADTQGATIPSFSVLFARVLVSE